MTNQNRKGKERERAVARMYRAAGFHADRYDAILEAAAGARHNEQRTGRDISVGDPAYPICIQVKVGKRPRLYPAYDEALEASEGYELPLVHLKRNSEGKQVPPRPPYRFAVLDERAWVRLLEHIRDEHGTDALHAALGAAALAVPRRNNDIKEGL